MLVPCEEHVWEMCGRICRVEAVVEPLSVKLRHVVLWAVAHQFWISESSPEDCHLAKGRFIRKLRASCTNGKGKRHSEINSWPRKVHILLSIQHSIHSTQDTAAKAMRLMDARQFKIRLVDDNDLVQSGMISTLLQKALLKELFVRSSHLLIAIEIAGDAIRGTLYKVIVTETWNHSKAKLLRFI